MESEQGTIAILSPMQKMELQKTLAELQEPGVRPSGDPRWSFARATRST